MSTWLQLFHDNYNHVVSFWSYDCNHRDVHMIAIIMMLLIMPSLSWKQHHDNNGMTIGIMPKSWFNIIAKTSWWMRSCCHHFDDITAIIMMLTWSQSSWCHWSFHHYHENNIMITMAWQFRSCGHHDLTWSQLLHDDCNHGVIILMT